MMHDGTLFRQFYCLSSTYYTVLFFVRLLLMYFFSVNFSFLLLHYIAYASHVALEWQENDEKKE